jgi:hypothetical protein
MSSGGLQDIIIEVRRPLGNSAQIPSMAGASFDAASLNAPRSLILS